MTSFASLRLVTSSNLFVLKNNGKALFSISSFCNQEVKRKASTAAGRQIVAFNNNKAAVMSSCRFFASSSAGGGGAPRQRQHTYVSGGRATMVSNAIVGVLALGAAVFAFSLFNHEFGDIEVENSNAAPAEQPQAPVTQSAFLDITIDNKPAGRIVIGLHGSVCPKTVENFVALCLGTHKDPSDGEVMTYEGVPFHRIIPNFMLQTGDFELHNGFGGRSIFGKTFVDENFKLKHVGPGIVSMANAGPDTNGSQFFITTQPTTHLDGRHVVFGTVTEGWDVCKKIESCGRRSGQPNNKVVIAKSGIL